jgi:hypothetical protein
MTTPIYGNLRGTTSDIFQVGFTGPNLKNTAGALDVRNPADSAFAIVRCADPVGPNDAVTLEFLQAFTFPGVVTVIRVAIALASVTSTTLLPAGARVLDAQVEITTPYTAGSGATISVGQSGAPDKFQAVTDNNPFVASIYDNVQDSTPNVVPAGVLVTIVPGTAVAGAGFVIVKYATTLP